MRLERQRQKPTLSGLQELCNRLIDAVNRLEERLDNLHGGPGVMVNHSPKATSIHLTRPPLVSGGGAGRPASSGTVKELGHVMGTQDTDTWNRETDKRPVKLWVLTDEDYNASFEGVVRARPMLFDSNGWLEEVGAEGDELQVWVTSLCPEE